ncbi:MAG TPA: ANTAR domain-containing protein [Marmoricola sp.]|nr:ANTAR domain-containing protein [Marmoricola sp.]
MEPIDETVAAVNELGPDGLLDELRRRANRAKEVVPDLVGVSIARLDQGLTFTLVASNEEIAILDGIQYVAGGPCVEGALTEEVRQFESQDVLDEARWQMFAGATAARAVRSTLTLPVLRRGAVVGTVNLYGASARAFDDQYDELAQIFGAWAVGAITNADLSFTTRDEAREAPRRIRDHVVVETAIGILAVRLGGDIDAAEDRLREAAARAGVSTFELAREIIRAQERHDPGEPGP